METQVRSPFYSSNSTGSHSTAPVGTPPPTGSPQRLALDNLIRRELRVGNPNDPLQIAQALLTRYKGTPRAAAIAQEAMGLPFLQTSPVETRVMQAPTSSDAELQQGIDDVERDLRELTTNNLLKDITPELEGWARQCAWRLPRAPRRRVLLWTRASVIKPSLAVANSAIMPV